MKVNENAALIPQNSGVRKTSVGSSSTALNPSSSNAAPANVSGPAVSLDIGLTAKLAEVQSDKTNKVSDEALIDKLRNQISSGDFKIDYQKISQSMLKDVVESIGQKPKQA